MIRSKYFDFDAALHLYKGGSSAPPPPDPMAQAQAQIAVQRQQQEWDAQQAAEAKRQADVVQQQKDAKAASDAEAAKARASSSRFNASTGGMVYGNSALKGLGLDPKNDQYGLLKDYDSALMAAINSAPEGTEDFAKYVNPQSIFDSVNQNVLKGQRASLNSQFNQKYAPDWERNTIADTMDDADLADILGEQRTEAQGAIDRAKARGTIGDAATTFAAKQLEKQATAGNARAQSLGSSVLNGYRDQLDKWVNPQRERLANWNYGDPSDLGYIQSGVDSRVAGFKNSLRGDLLNTIGDTNFFDPDTILGKAGNYQGVANTPGTGNDPLGSAFATTPLTEEEKKKQTAATGILGTTGVI